MELPKTLSISKRSVLAYEHEGKQVRIITTIPPALLLEMVGRYNVHDSLLAGCETVENLIL